MSKGLVFWLIMLVAIILALVTSWPSSVPGSQRYNVASSLVVWILLFLLGWAVFGFIIQ